MARCVWCEDTNEMARVPSSLSKKMREKLTAGARLYFFREAREREARLLRRRGREGALARHAAARGSVGGR